MIDLTNVMRISGTNGYQRYGFENCTSLKDVIINPNMIELGYKAFYNCTALEEIDLSHVKTIYGDALKGAIALKNVTSLANVESIDIYAFADCKSLSIDLALPALKGTLNDNAFVSSGIVRILDLGQVEAVGTGTNSYGWGPFRYCKSLIQVVLPATVKNIGWGAFDSCTSLQWVKILAISPPTLHDQAFDKTNNCPIYVPDVSLSAYKSADKWNTYANRIRPLSEFVE